jgi:hypothetical protein
MDTTIQLYPPLFVSNNYTIGKIERFDESQYDGMNLKELKFHLVNNMAIALATDHFVEYSKHVDYMFKLFKDDADTRVELSLKVFEKLEYLRLRNPLGQIKANLTFPHPTTWR